MLFAVRDKVRSCGLYVYIFHFGTLLFIAVPLILVFISSFGNTGLNNLRNSTEFVNQELLFGGFRSLFVSFFTIFFVLVISYPFAYGVSLIKNQTNKAFILFLITSPLGSSVFVKLIGLKSFFDLISGEFNSTRGLLYVIIGLVYINLPVAIINFYNVFTTVPKNILNASLDLGETRMNTLFKILIPYTKSAIVSAIFMVFIPSFTTISVADFMNSSSKSRLVGQMIQSYSEYGVSEDITRQRMSMLILVFSSITFALYLMIKLSPRFIKILRTKCCPKHNLSLY